MERLKQIFLTIWQFPQILLGWLVLSFIDMNKVELINGKLMVYSSSMSGGISLGYVRDFIKLNFINFPIFNISDIFINISVLAIMVIIIKNEINSRRNK